MLRWDDEFRNKCREEIKKLPDHIVALLNESIKERNRPTITANDRFNSWYNEIQERKTIMIPYNFVDQNGLKIGHFHNNFMGTLTGKPKSNQYTDDLSNWLERLKQLDDDLKNQLQAKIDKGTRNFKIV